MQTPMCVSVYPVILLNFLPCVDWLCTSPLLDSVELFAASPRLILLFKPVLTLFCHPETCFLLFPLQTVRAPRDLLVCFDLSNLFPLSQISSTSFMPSLFSVLPIAICKFLFRGSGTMLALICKYSLRISLCVYFLFYSIFH